MKPYDNFDVATEYLTHSVARVNLWTQHWSNYASVYNACKSIPVTVRDGPKLIGAQMTARLLALRIDYPLLPREGFWYSFLLETK
jgi:hypothetical protein